MKVKTEIGKTYAVTSAAACTVTDPEGAVIVTVEAGTQAYFVSPLEEVEISVDSAKVTPFNGALGPAASAGGGGASGGGITVDQEFDSLSTNPQSGTAVWQGVDGALFDTAFARHRTIEGTGNASLHWLQLDARRVPAGRLQAIEIPCRSSGMSGVGESAVWLTLFEQPEVGADWLVAGSSVQPVQQAAGQTARWEFDGVTLSGRALRICAAAEPGVWAEDQWLGVRMAPREDGEESRARGNSTVNQVTDLSFEMVETSPKFASAADVEGHVADASVHVTAEERARWDAAAEGGTVSGDYAAASHVGDATHLQNGGQKLVVKGMDGGTKFTVQGLLTNAQVTGSALHVNVPDFTQRSTSVCLYSNSDSASYIPWFAAAVDATPLEAFGITEPGVHVGHAGYPLRLKGGVVSINGTNIDAAALAQLLAHKDELLALLAGVPENASAGDGDE